MPVPDSHDLTPQQRRAAAALLRRTVAPVAGLARLFARHGHQLALVAAPSGTCSWGANPVTST